jgi:hypothetical protein
MSQFAAHKEAGGNAPARPAELTPDPGTTPHRGTAQGFRELRQRLKSLPAPPAPAPPPAPPKILDHVSPEAPRPRDEPAEASAEVEGEGPADTHAFDLSSLFGGGEPPPMLDFSGLDRAPAGRLLLGGTIPSEALAAREEEALTQPPAAGEVSAAAPLETLTPQVKPAELKQELKQLRLPELPAIDEFALVDEPPQTEDEPAAQGPARAPEPETPAADPPPRAFWQDEETKAEPPLEVAAAIEHVNIESEEAGDVARSLLEIMSLPANTTQPQERALAADSLLHLLDRLPLKTLIAMVERLSIMETPPPLILAELIHDTRIEVAGPLLEKCSAIDDQDLLAVIADGHLHSNRMIARRRTLASVICDALIATEDASAILTLVRNPAAGISHEAFFKLNDFARRHPSLQAPLATRADLPAPVAFELFWVLPAELRRYVISRFLTDSATLNKILKLTQRMEEQEPAPRFASGAEIERLFGLLTEGDRRAAQERLSELLGIAPPTAERILSDAHGEALAVACKALGASRADFERCLASLKEAKAATLHLDASPADLQSFFETLSFNKARVLLTYWDWAILRSGPYAGLTAT